MFWTRPPGRLFLLSLLVLALLTVPVLAQEAPAPAATAPAAVAAPIDLKDPAAIQAGKDMFRVSCTTYCHGREARGGGHRGPSLRNGGFDNDYLFMVITGGRASMPAYKGVYNPEQIWNLIAYIQSLKD